MKIKIENNTRHLKLEAGCLNTSNIFFTTIFQTPIFYFRSPSPEPIYSSDGKRLNTREYRTRRKLEEERHNLIQKILKLNPEFKPPPDYK
jgi:hypothetical protein